MNRLPQDAADTLEWHERHKQGYGPIKWPVLTGRFEHFTLAQKQAHINWLKQHEQNLPF